MYALGPGTGEGLYEVQPCTSTSDTVCDACLNQAPPPHFGIHPEQQQRSEAQVAANTDYERQCGHRNNAAPSQQRNLLSTLTIADNGKKRTTSGNLIHFLSPTDVIAAVASPAGDVTNSGLTAGGNSTENVLPTGSFPSGTYSRCTYKLSTLSLSIALTSLIMLLPYSSWYMRDAAVVCLLLSIPAHYLHMRMVAAADWHATLFHCERERIFQQKKKVLDRRGEETCVVVHWRATDWNLVTCRAFCNEILFTSQQLVAYKTSLNIYINLGWKFSLLNSQLPI